MKNHLCVFKDSKGTQHVFKSRTGIDMSYINSEGKVVMNPYLQPKDSTSHLSNLRDAIINGNKIPLMDLPDATEDGSVLTYFRGGGARGTDKVEDFIEWLKYNKFSKKTIDSFEFKDSDNNRIMKERFERDWSDYDRDQ